MHNRWFKAIVWFQHWPAMTTNRIAKMVAAVGKPGLTAQGRLQHIKIGWPFSAGSLRAGALSAVMMAYLKGGKDEVGVLAGEAKDDPFEFMLHSLGYPMVRGMLAALQDPLGDNHDTRLL